VRAVLDSRLLHFVREGRIRIGTKLMVSAASLVGFDDGIDPLDPKYNTKSVETSPALCLAANSCRLARWDARLGFVQRRRQTIENEGMLRVKSVSDLFDDGGKVPLMDFVVVKKFPVLFLNQDLCSSKARVLSEAEEYQRIRKLDKGRQFLMERYADEVEAECLEVRGAVWHGFRTVFATN
jgi:hypothetical protein